MRPLALCILLFNSVGGVPAALAAAHFAVPYGVQATVHEAYGEALEGEWSGHGFFWETRYAVTAYHVISQMDEIAVKDTKGKTYFVDSFCVSAAHDLALLRLERDHRKATYPLVELPLEGETLGYHLTVPGMAIYGEVAQPKEMGEIKERTAMPVTKVTMAGQKGFSGNAVFSENGIAGLIAAINATQTWLVPSDVLKSELPKLRACIDRAL